MQREISNPHDRFFKKLFSRERVGKDFIINYLPPEIVSLIDIDSSELVKDSFTNTELGEYFSDMIYKVRLKDGTTAHIYILFEHKSYSDPMAGFQILCYMVRIWEKIIQKNEQEKKARRKEGKKSKKEEDEQPFCLPRILPVLICHGRYNWNVPTNFVSLFEPRPELDAYTPDFRYLLCDLSRYSDNEIKGTAMLKAGMLLMKYIFSDRLAERLPEILGLLRDIAATRSGLEFLKTVMVYLTRGTDKINKEELGKAVMSAFPETGGEVMATVAEQWIKEGEARGEARGRAEGEARGRAIGKAEGKLIGQILLGQRILRDEKHSQEELEKKSLEELRTIFSNIESRLTV